MENDIINVNSGVIELKPQLGAWIAGEETGIVYEERCKDWTPYLPSNEKQYNKKFDTMACVSFSALNAIETQMNFLIANNLLTPAQFIVIKELGFIDENNKFNCSDRFTAKMSGTTKNGNYLEKVGDSIRNDGILPEKDWKWDDTFNWDGFYSEIPQALKDKAKKIKDIIQFNTEWVIIKEWNQNVVNVLKYQTLHSPIQIAAPVCPMWSRFTLKPEDTVKTCPSVVPQHATIVYGVDEVIRDFDHYNPFAKKLALDYPIPYGFKILATIKKDIVIPIVMHIFTTPIKYGEKNNEVGHLQDFLINKGFLKIKIPTKYYGEMTRKAVKNFQTFYQVASQQEIEDLNGKTFGPKSIAKANEILKK